MRSSKALHVLRKLHIQRGRVAKVGSLLARAKMAMKFLSSACLLFARQMRRFCGSLQICKFNSVKYAISMYNRKVQSVSV